MWARMLGLLLGLVLQVCYTIVTRGVNQETLPKGLETVVDEK
jgi:hypothetical protein